jgi:hypothetical protein
MRVGLVLGQGLLGAFRWIYLGLALAVGCADASRLHGTDPVQLTLLSICPLCKRNQRRHTRAKNKVGSGANWGMATK